MTESPDLFATLDPPSGGPARLRLRMDQEKRRSARLRRLRSAAVVSVLGGARPIRREERAYQSVGRYRATRTRRA